MLKFIQNLRLPLIALLLIGLIYGGLTFAQAKSEKVTTVNDYQSLSKQISDLKTEILEVKKVAETPIEKEVVKIVEVPKYITVKEEVSTPAENQIETVTTEPVVTQTETIVPTTTKTVTTTTKKTTPKSTTTVVEKPTNPVVIKPAKEEASVTVSRLGTYKVEITSTDTAFSLLQKAGTKNGFSITYDTYSFGVFVTSIGGIKAENGKFWAFYYNGAFSSVGASAQKVTNGDTTSWKLENM